MKIMRAAVWPVVAMVAILFADHWARGDDERAPLPSAAEIAGAEKLIADLYGSEYAKTSPASRVALAAKLLEQAGQSKNDPVGRYVLLRDARDLAAKGGDPATASKAADALATEYRLGAGAAYVPMAAPLTAAPMMADKARVAAEVLLSAAEAARDAEAWDETIELLTAADASARKAKSFALANQAKAQLAQVEKAKAEAAKVKEPLAALKANPNDPAANLAVGRYLCLVKRDWEAALPLLAKGATGPLKEAVGRDLKAAGGDDAAWLVAADSWYELASRTPADSQAPLQARAYYWYQLALPQTSGLAKAKIEKRLAELQPAAEDTTQKARGFGFVRKAVAERKLNRCRLIGGAFAHSTFEEIPPGGGILIGFRYTTNRGGRYPGVVQPIFLAASGEIYGKVYGTPERGAVLEVTKAKPGYAVGALFVRGGGGFDAFQPIFMRVKGNGLDTGDRYDGPYVGGQGGGSGTLGGDGNFIVGLHGKVGDADKMEAMSPILLSSEVSSPSPPSPAPPSPKPIHPSRNPTHSKPGHG